MVQLLFPFTLVPSCYIRILLLWTNSRIQLLSLTGPNAKQVLSTVTDFDLSSKSFPFFSYREIDIGLVNGIRAMNLTHTGELGWVLYIPNEVINDIYNTLAKPTLYIAI